MSNVDTRVLSIDGQVRLQVCKFRLQTDNFVNKWTNNKRLFARGARGKRIKENRLGFCFLFSV